jgi:putative sterol carrier protein
MSEKVKYLSQEWRDEAERRLKQALDSEKMNNLNASMTNIYNDCPDGQKHYLYMKMVDGNFDSFISGVGEPPQADFVLTGSYDVYARISRAELGAQLALMTGKLKLKGNMVRAIKLAKISDRINKIFAEIPTEF